MKNQLLKTAFTITLQIVKSIFNIIRNVIKAEIICSVSVWQIISHSQCRAAQLWFSEECCLFFLARHPKNMA